MFQAWDEGTKAGRKHRKQYQDQPVRQLVRDVAHLKGLINTEFKSRDTAVANTVSTSGTVISINSTAEGNGIENRSGEVARMKSVQWKLEITKSTSNSKWDFVRCMLVLDKQPNEALASVTDIIETADEVAFRSLSHRKRFVILHDKMFVLDDKSCQAIYDEYYRKIDLRTIYDAGNAGTIADITSNALLLVIIGEEATNFSTVGGNVRVRFVDN